MLATDRLRFIFRSLSFEVNGHTKAANILRDLRETLPVGRMNAMDGGHANRSEGVGSQHDTKIRDTYARVEVWSARETSLQGGFPPVSLRELALVV